METQRSPAPEGRTKTRLRRPVLKDPGYLTIRAICSRLVSDIKGDDDDPAVGRFIRDIEEFVAYSGRELLDRMQISKKLVKVVSDELRVAKREIDTTFCEVDAEHIFELFPMTPKERNFDRFYAGIKATKDRFGRSE